MISNASSTLGQLVHHLNSIHLIALPISLVVKSESNYSIISVDLLRGSGVETLSSQLQYYQPSHSYLSKTYLDVGLKPPS